MSLLDFLSKKSTEQAPAKPSNDPKLLAENQQVLAGMQDLVNKLNAPDQGLSMEEYLERLRKEGSGL